VRTSPVGTAAFSVCFLLLAESFCHAQSPPRSDSPPSASSPPASSSAASPPTAPVPLPGFVPPYEITKIVRAAGFDPLAPPLREGTTYVVRAADSRGVLMRVVVDARSGALRAYNRIVAAPAPYGIVGTTAPAYRPAADSPPLDAPTPSGPPPAGPPPYGMPADIAAPELGPNQVKAALGTPPMPPSANHSGAHSLVPDLPPLPRPRPVGLTSRKTRPGAKLPQAPPR
jgi:hypothetical protein